MSYVIEPSLDDFNGIAGLRGLVERSLEAANSGTEFSDTIMAKSDGKPIRLYVRVIFTGDLPVSLEIGQDHRDLLGEDVLQELRDIPNLRIDTQEKWAVIPFVRRD
jgi:hypothetical protein